jgi:hypothetical protein
VFRVESLADVECISVGCIVGAAALFIKSCLSFTSSGATVSRYNASDSITNVYLMSSSDTTLGLSFIDKGISLSSNQRFSGDNLLLSSFGLGGAALVTKLMSIEIKDRYHRK